LKRFIKPKYKKRGKPSVYNKPLVVEPLERIWHSANFPCPKRLKVVLPLWLPSYEKEFGRLPIFAVRALLKMTPSTIDRLLKPTRIKYKKRGRAKIKPSALLRKQIPIKTNQWDIIRSGFLVADTVVHCGDSLIGMFAYIIDFADIFTSLDRTKGSVG
jgi:hypothetical protein